jgi:hypothetical protein
MPAIVASLATHPPHELPIWARLQLMDMNLPFASITHWQYDAPGVIIAHRPAGLLLLICDQTV